MRLPDAEHTTRPWRIHEIAPDFRVEDVWAYRTPGAGPGDFPVMLDALRAAGGLHENPPVVKLLFAVRWKLGALFGWDQPEHGLAGRVESLCDRLPPDLRQDAAGTAVPNTPFTMVYELPDECAIELANKTVHDICHLGWVPTGEGDYELRMAALVQPHGALGRAYLAAIKPIRYLIVCPALTRKWERAWRDRDQYTAAGSSSRLGRVDLDPTAAKRGRAPRRGGPWGRLSLLPGRLIALGRAAVPPERGEDRLVEWAGRLLVLYGAAHTLGALTVEGAARHAGTWFSGQLWGQDLADMSPAMSAYWLSVNSFGPPLTLLGVTVLWLNRRGLTPPSWLAWSLLGWAGLDTLVSGPGAGQNVLLLVAGALLLGAAHRGAPRVDLAPGTAELAPSP